ncbi:MAG: DUF86 domain-containing protein [archaeon]|nr:DUF86 domain-containing protein [Nanoarchaeota archaeon]
MKKVKLFDNIHNYLSDMEEILPEEELFLKSKVHQYSISMLMMNLINACVDLGTELINLKQLGYPGSYRDVFQILQKNKMISSSLAKKMKDLVGLRNILAHEYGEIDLEILHEQASNLDFIEDFTKEIVKYFD